MRRAGWLVVIGACSAVPQVEVANKIVELPGLGLRITVPVEAEVVRTQDGLAELHFRPGGRWARGLELVRVEAGAADEVFDEVDGALRYRLTRIEAGGSGGDQLELRGRLDVGGRVFAARCTDQGELSQTVDWCLQALASVRPAAP